VQVRFCGKVRPERPAGLRDLQPGTPVPNVNKIPQPL
jgi:hypothetical protein